MSGAKDPRAYWEGKILDWESSRYAGWALAKPASWTVRNRMHMAFKLAVSLLPAGGHCVELGCGSGLLAEKILSSRKDISFLGMDFSEKAIDLARKRVSTERADFRCEDVLKSTFSPADLMIFLGLLDWLEPADIPHFFAKIQASTILFSFTQKTWNSMHGPYAWYRAYCDSFFNHGVCTARAYEWPEVEGWLKVLGAGRVELIPTRIFDPGRIVVYRRH